MCNIISCTTYRKLSIDRCEARRPLVMYGRRTSVPICRSPSTRTTGRGALSMSRRHESSGCISCAQRVWPCAAIARITPVRVCRLRHITSRAFTITHIAAGARECDFRGSRTRYVRANGASKQTAALDNTERSSCNCTRLVSGVAHSPHFIETLFHSSELLVL